MITSNMIEENPYLLSGIPYIKKFNIEFHVDWWDGPLSGVTKIEEEPFWFLFVKDIEFNDGITRIGDAYIYTIMKLTKKEYEYELYWHKLFQMIDTSNTSNTSNSDDLHEFYAKRKAEYHPIDYKTQPVFLWSTDRNIDTPDYIIKKLVENE